MMFSELIGTSAALAAVRAQLARVVERSRGAQRLPPVLLQGETGTGKGLLARALHDASARRAGPFVDVNCAAIPESLIEAEMFGFERGAFTDARQAKPGLFQAAGRGSIFLDEVGLLPEALQGKLLKVIEERTVRRLGATRNEPVDAWVIAATSEDLEAATRAGRFRRDLYHRLAVVAVRLPALRERSEDVVLLAEHFLARARRDYGLPAMTLADDARAALAAHAWPGNVRELANVIERAALLADRRVITTDLLELPEPGPEGASGADAPSLRDALRSAEREQLLEALQQSGWNLSRAAARLSLPRNTLLYRMERQGLRPPPPSRRRGADAAADADGVRGDEPATDDPTRRVRRRLALLRVEIDGKPLGSAPDARLLDAVAEKVNAFGGRVEELSDDGLAAVFGVEPVEDAPRRAALAALSALRSVERVRRDPAATRTARAALHVAECVLGGAGHSVLADGEEAAGAWAVAKETGRAAPAGAVAITAAAARFLERRFDLAPAPGTIGPSAAYVLSGPERTGFAFSGRVTAFTGRRQELALLQSRLDSAAERRGQVVAVVGEAGMGKSRLLSQFREAIDRRPVTWLEGQCLSYATAIPYLPIVAVVRQACGIAEGDAGKDAAVRIEATLHEAGLEAEDALYLLHLVDADAAAGRLQHVAAERLKARTRDVFRRLLVALSRKRPLVVCLEDLHWIDRTSDEVLAAVVETLGGASLLLVATYRPGYHGAWLAQSHVTQLALPPLSAEDSLVVLRSALDHAPVPADALAALAGRADGNPFFLEELARDFDEHGTREGVPETVQGVLGARIDRLAAADRRILQSASVAGRDVSPALLRAITGEPEAALRARLERLRAAGFLEARPAADVVYAFKHALTQEVAYATVDPVERREQHGRVADAIRTLSPEVARSRPEVLAAHLTAAGRTAEAIPQWLRAGRDAVRRSANVEAASHLQTALRLLAGNPPSADRDRLELELQLALGPPLIMTQGYAAAEVEAAYRRAESLSEHLREPPQIFSALWGISIFHIVRGDLRSARAVAERLLAAASRSGSDDLRVEAHLACGAALFHQGLLAEARAHLERSVALYDPERHGGHAFLYGQDPCVAACGFLGRTLLLAGEEEAAAALIERALRQAESIDHPFTRAFSLLNAAQLHELRGDFPAVLPYTERAIALASEHGFPLLLGAGISMRGQVRVAEGRYEEGLRLIQDGVATWRATGAALSLAYYLGVIADAYRAAGDRERALAHLARALPAAAQGGEHLSEPELHRLHGELLAADPRSGTEAEAAFARALSQAQGQGAWLFARRAAASLGRYLRSRGRDTEADRVDRELRERAGAS